MSALPDCVKIKVYFLISFLLLFSCRHVRGAEYVSPADLVSMKSLASSGWDIIKSTFSLIDELESLRQKHINKPSFEVGYLMFTTFEKYRQMVDKFNTSHFMGSQLFTMEVIMYLEEIEGHYWEVEHLVNMLHEIERKFGVHTPPDSKYREMTSEELKEIQAKAKAAKFHRQTIDMVETKPTRISKKDKEKMSPPKSTTTRGPYPVDYGWG